jgi:CheY-like chemotaxis protein
MSPTVTSWPLRILVVDDDYDMVETMALWLRRRGHDVLTAGSGLAAITLASGFRPDLVLLDLSMHGMDGWEVTRRLRHDPATRNTYVVYVTGLDAEAHFRQSTEAEAGCNEHWLKPILPSQLEGLLLLLQRRQ